MQKEMQIDTKAKLFQNLLCLRARNTKDCERERKVVARKSTAVVANLFCISTNEKYVSEDIL